MKISICGKGGSGKSVVTVLLAEELARRGYEILIVDSDESNTGLCQLLGFDHLPEPLTMLAGGRKQIFELFPKIQVPYSSSPDNVMRHKILISEIPPRNICKQNNINFVSVGKITQPHEGCACPMGLLSREFLKNLHLLENQVAIVDMEAGVEHFGRGVESSIDSVLIVIDPSHESIVLAEQIFRMTGELGKNNTWAIINKVPSDKVALHLKSALKTRNIPAIGCIPHSQEIFEACLVGKPLPPNLTTNIKYSVDYLLNSKVTNLPR